MRSVAAASPVGAEMQPAPMSARVPGLTMAVAGVTMTAAEMASAKMPAKTAAVASSATTVLR
jgi:hypothetical protein